MYYEFYLAGDLLLSLSKEQVDANGGVEVVRSTLASVNKVNDSLVTYAIAEATNVVLNKAMEGIKGISFSLE